MAPARPLIIFDFDDTLAITEKHLRPAYFTYLHEKVSEHRPLPFETFMEHTRIFNRQGYGTYGWAKELGLPEDWALQLHCDIGPTLVAATLPHVGPCPKLPGLLQQLKERGHTLAILTHGHMSYVLPMLAGIHLGELFPASHIFDVTTANGALKSNTATYQEVLDKLGFKGTEALMVEDNPKNLLAAKKLGIATVLVGHGYPRDAEYENAIDTHHPTALAAVEYLLA